MGDSLRPEGIHVQQNDNQLRRLGATVVVSWSRTSEKSRVKRPTLPSRKINKLRVFDGPAVFRLPLFSSLRTPPAHSVSLPSLGATFRRFPEAWNNCRVTIGSIRHNSDSATIARTFGCHRNHAVYAHKSRLKARSSRETRSRW